MDEKTKLMICLATSTATNCMPCFEHFYEEARVIKLPQEEIQGAIQIALQVKNGAGMAMKNFLDDTLGLESDESRPCCDRSDAGGCS